MDLPALYDEDMYAWCLHQAEVLRRLKTSGVALPNDLDLDHVAEEIEDLGNELRFQVESNLEQALVHLVKIATQPDDEAVNHWLGEVVAFLDVALKRYRPSMRRALDAQAIWATARRQLLKKTRYTGPALPPLPESAPFTLDDLLDDNADPGDLAARLAAAIANTPA